MKRAGTLVITVFFLSSALAGCGGSREVQGNALQDDGEAPTQATSEEVVVGGFAIDGPTGREISIPETSVAREDVGSYVRSVRPLVVQSALDLSRFVDPSAELQDGTVTLSIGVEPIEEAREKADDGLVALRLVEPPEDLEPVHELLLAAYVQGISAYDNVIGAFESGDLELLTEALQENLPEIEQLTAETRSILQELERALTVGDDQA